MCVGGRECASSGWLSFDLFFPPSPLLHSRSPLQKPYQKIARRKHNAPRTGERVAKTVGKLLRKENKKRAKLASIGIDYDFAGYAATVRLRL